MTRTRTSWVTGLALLALLALLLALQACAKATPEVSSGSNWLTCESLDDCGDGRAVRCSHDGYCLDADDERIAAAGPDASAGSPTAGKPSLAPNDAPASPGATGFDASVERDGGQGAVMMALPDSGRIQPSSPVLSACDQAGAHDPLIPRNSETCYQFAVHGASTETDDTPFPIAIGESYNQFYYAIPWPAGTVATSYGVVDDASMSVHAWLFSTASGNAPGTVSVNVTGTLLGENARLLGAWASGGCNVVLPDDTGLELPDSGNLVVQWHHENGSDSARDDRSDFRVCTVPAATRPNAAGITILGTENFNGATGAPAGPSQFGSACTNDSGDHVTILALSPQMHRIGARAIAVVERAAGDSEVVFDAPFVFGDAHHYPFDPTVVMFPGDVIRSSCMFDNTTGMNVPFGQSSHQENCFLFAIAYPARALDNGALSLIGATNTCW